MVQLQQVEREQQPVLVGHRAIGAHQGFGLGFDPMDRAGLVLDQVERRRWQSMNRPTASSSLLFQWR
jgi:hypothetical protein